jgi:hypothetical protein
MPSQLVASNLASNRDVAAMKSKGKSEPRDILSEGKSVPNLCATSPFSVCQLYDLQPLLLRQWSVSFTLWLFLSIGLCLEWLRQSPSCIYFLIVGFGIITYTLINQSSSSITSTRCLLFGLSTSSTPSASSPSPPSSYCRSIRMFSSRRSCLILAALALYFACGKVSHSQPLRSNPLTWSSYNISANCA